MQEPDWGALIGWRNRLARYWQRRHGAVYPLEEYLSAGNLGLSEACARHTATRGGFGAHVRQRMRWRMQEVPRAAEGEGRTHTPDGRQRACRWATVSATDPQVLARRRGVAGAEREVFALEWAFRQLPGLSPQERLALWGWLADWTPEELAAATGERHESLHVALWQAKRKLRLHLREV